MVKIVLAGGAGNVGREIIDALIENGTHELTVFTRSGAPDLEKNGVKVIKVDYNDKSALIQHLTGVDVVLSFVVASSDPEGITQKNLIDASVAAAVKRFAPSEWATRSNSGSVNYNSKDIVSAYLREINKEKQVLEYTLFQPGLFSDYLSHPYPTAKHMAVFGVQWDLNNRRAIVPADGDFPVTFTTVKDLARVVVEAINYKGTWPETGGIEGTTLKNSELIKLAESIRGPFKIETVSRADLEAGKLNTSWVPQVDHPSIPPEYRSSELSENLIAVGMLACVDGAWAVTDEWNRLLPHLKLAKLDDFLRQVWEGKP